MTQEEELSAICSRIEGLRKPSVKAADIRQAALTKPAGSLGRLEKVAAQLAGIYGDLERRIERRAVFVFVADHGVTEAGVSAFPAEVTRQMLLNFSTGGAAVNVLARHAGAEVFVCDVGVKGEPIDDPRIVSSRVRPGTANMLDQPAMDRDEALAAIFAGIQLFRLRHAEAPFDLIATGEMGIGNTTAASALVAGLLDGEAVDLTGRGTGIDDASHARKIDAVRQAVLRHRPSLKDPVGALAGVGGLEIGALTGLVIAAAEARVPVLIDGFIAGAAALLAHALAPLAGEFMLASHRSVEPGHAVVLGYLGLDPLLDLELRLGEGSGALLAMPIVEAGWRLFQEMATFDQAGVSGRD